jgi:hypothetical protein
MAVNKEEIFKEVYEAKLLKVLQPQAASLLSSNSGISTDGVNHQAKQSTIEHINLD